MVRMGWQDTRGAMFDGMKETHSRVLGPKTLPTTAFPSQSPQQGARAVAVSWEVAGVKLEVAYGQPRMCGWGGAKRQRHTMMRCLRLALCFTTHQPHHHHNTHRVQRAPCALSCVEAHWTGKEAQGVRGRQDGRHSPHSSTPITHHHHDPKTFREALHSRFLPSPFPHRLCRPH